MVVIFLPRVAAEKFVGFAQHVAVEGAGQAPFPGKDDGQNIVLRALGEQRMLGCFDARHGGAQHASQFRGVRPRGQRGFLRATQTGRGDKLHRAGNLLGVFHRADAAPEIEKSGHFLRSINIL